MWVRLLRGLAITSGALIGAAAVLALKRNPVPGRTGCGYAEVPSQRDYFHITRSRGKAANQKWVLQGFGRYQCFLLFNSWAEAMEQATFRVETLQTAKSELVEIQTV